jgi:CHAD domain-containing protein
VIERELKLALPGRFELPSLVTSDGPLLAEPLPELRLRATYHDTDDLRLARHGLTLRHRIGDADGSGWTLKLPKSVGHDGVLVRDELRFGGEPREVPAEARGLVSAWVRTAALRPVATLRTRRRRWALLDAERRVLAETADDEVSVLEGRRVVARFRELEVESASDELDLGVLRDQLLAAGATVAEPIPKVVRALGSRATAPPDVQPPALDERAVAADLVAALVADCYLRIQRNDILARLGDEEGIHQLRVAARRLRSDLRTFADLFDADWLARIEEPLRTYGRRLGRVRDLDVLLERLRHDAGKLVDILQPVWDDIGRRRAQAHERLLAALAEPGWIELLDLLVEATRRPPVESEAEIPAAELASSRAMRVWRQLADGVKGLESDSEDAAFHEVRILAKRARYAAEAAAHALDPKAASSARRYADAIGELQDLLGIIQDAAIAASELDAAVERHAAEPSVVVAIGRLVERQAQQAGTARRRVPKAWKDLRRPRMGTWATG